MREVAFEERMRLDLRNGDSFHRVGVEDSLEEVLKVFVALQRRYVEVGGLYLLLESKALAAFGIKFLLEGSLVVSFELEGILVYYEIEQQYSCRPNVDLRAIPVLGEKFRSQERSTTDYFEHSFLPLQKLTH